LLQIGCGSLTCTIPKRLCSLTLQSSCTPNSFSASMHSFSTSIHSFSTFIYSFFTFHLYLLLLHLYSLLLPLYSLLLPLYSLLHTLYSLLLPLYGCDPYGCGTAAVKFTPNEASYTTLRPRPNCLSSSNISPPFSSATSSHHLQLVLVFSHLFLLWKSATIIPIHKPANSPASFRPISLTSCLFKLFERLVLNRLCFYLESKNLISLTQAGFRPGRSTADQVLFLFQSIWDDFQKKRPPDRTVLATIDFSKAFVSIWHSALFHKLLVLGLPPFFVR